ncbi:MAG TPA: hypothetical protein VHR86_08145, partial [Armatimonadota bacterium]|nr:hypothetical protein [Armatimonadota bacterium]
MLLLESALLGLRSLLTATIWEPSLHHHLLLLGRLVHAVSLFCCTGLVSLCLFYPTGHTTTSKTLRVQNWVTAIIIGVFTIFSPLMLIRAEMRPTGIDATYGPLRHCYFAYILLCIIW